MQLRCSAPSGWRAGVAQVTQSLRHGVLAMHPRHSCPRDAHVMNSSSGSSGSSGSIGSSSSISTSQPAVPVSIADSTHGTSSRGPPLGAVSRRRNAWTPDQAAQFSAAMAALGGPYKANARRMLAMMPDAGLSVQQLSNYLQRLRAQLPTAGGAADSEGLARQGLRHPGMTGDQVGQFECAVAALGGPMEATTPRLMAHLQQVGLNSLQIAGRLHRLRRVMRVNGLGGIEAMHKMREDFRGSGHSLDVQQRIDAAIRAQGGPWWATAKRTQELEPDMGLQLHVLRRYLTKERGNVWTEARGSDGGGNGSSSGGDGDGSGGGGGGGDGNKDGGGGGASAKASTGVHTAQDGGTATPLRLLAAAGGGPPRGWTPEQSQHFLQALHDLGGTAEASCAAVFELVKRRLPDNSLNKKQVYYGLERLREGLARAGVAAVAQGDGAGPALARPASRESEGIAVASLWVKDEVRLMWSPELFECLEAAVSKLGGLERAKPLAILPLMGRFNLTKIQVASALQTLRNRAHAASRAAAGGVAIREIMFRQNGKRRVVT